MAKREHEVEEFDDVSRVLHPSPNAKKSMRSSLWFLQ